VLTTATRLFGEHGWAATGMRDVAREARVSVETVYASFGTKADLLMASIDLAVVGDAEPVPLNQRPEFAELGQGDLEHRFGAAARLIVDIHRRTAGVNFALREAAASDPRLEHLMREREQGRRENVAQGLVLVLGHPVAAEQVDAIWALVDIGVYRSLRDLRGWSDETYASWLAQTLSRLLSDVQRG
jgi:AcrR family transcriptional regulator